MCERCGGGIDRRIEVTDDTVGEMIHETTHVALQASAAYANGWFDAARGFVSDMSATWGTPGMVRMAYVWGAARFFLPSPPGRPAAPGHKEMAELARQAMGKEPDPDQVARLVAQGDQIGAACNAVAQAASKGDLDALADALHSFSTERSSMTALVLSLMSDAGVRLRHSRDTEDERAYDLFMAHVRADLPADADGDGGEDKGEETGGGTV
jgi:hypothetical protein